MVRLHKNLNQSWFHPFAGPTNPNLPKSMALHREGLMRVVRRDIHDNPTIWFVKEDGSNISEVMADLMAVITTEGIRMLKQLTDPKAAIELVRSGTLLPRPGSPAANELVRAARNALDEYGLEG